MRSDDRTSRRPALPWLRNNVLSLVAIFLALGGTAVAAQIATSEDATTAKKKKVKRGPRGPQGPAGPAGSAVAYAHVAADGTLDTANSKNIASATQLEAVPGYYCVTPSVPVRNMVASADSSSGGGNYDASASFTDNLTSCPPDAVVVTTYAATAGSGTTAFPFYVVFN